MRRPVAGPLGARPLTLPLTLALLRLGRTGRTVAAGLGTVLAAALLLGLALRLALRLGLGPGPLLGLAGADGGDALGDGDLETLRRLRLVVEPVQRSAG